MSVFFRSRQLVERRDITGVPWNYGATLGQAASQDTALTLAPVFAAVRHITDSSSTLPLKGYRKTGDVRAPMVSLPRLFADLEAQGRLVPWLAQCMASLVVRGNAVGYINARDGFGFPTDITWLDVDRVAVDESTGVPQWTVDGRKVDGPAPGRLVTNLDLVHVPWITVPGQTLGLSPIAYYAATVSAGLGAQEYGSSWFKGGFPASVFRNTEKVLKPGAAETIRERLKASIKKREPLVTGRDWEFQPVAIPPNETGFIETQRLSANAIAAIYGIDPTEIGGEVSSSSLTYSTEELRQIKRLANLRPYLVRLESAFASWLPELQFVRFNGDAILRADLATRWNVNKVRVDMGAASINEIRAQEDQPPIPGGDAYSRAPTTGQPVNEPPAAPVRRLSAVDYGGQP